MQARNRNEARELYLDGYNDGWSDAERAVKINARLVHGPRRHYGMWALLALFLAGCAGLIMQVFGVLR